MADFGPSELGVAAVAAIGRGEQQAQAVGSRLELGQ